MTNFISFVILCFLLYGRGMSKRSARRHGYFMSAVIAADLTLIAYLIIVREAMDKITPNMSWLLMSHIGFAMTTVILYLLALYIGIRLLSGHSHPNAMRRLDRVIVPVRILTLLTSIALKL